MAENKTKATKVSVAAFIDAIQDEARRSDAKALVKLMQKAAGEKPKMWDRRSSALAVIITCTTAGARATCR
jgi:hypothetical protein